MAAGWLVSLSLVAVGAAVGGLTARARQFRRRERPGSEGAALRPPAVGLAPEAETATTALDRASSVARDAAARLEQREASAERGHLSRVLRDVADALGADEAIFWEWDAAADSLRARSWSGEGMPRPTHFHMVDWAPLVQWAAESRIIQCEGDGETTALAAAPVIVQDELVGVLSVSREGGLRSDRHALRGWLPRHARQVAMVLELASVNRRMARHDWRFDELWKAVNALQQRGLEDAPRALCEVALDVTGAPFAALVRWKSSGEGVVELATPGLGLATRQKVVLDSLVGSVCDGKLPLTLEDARSLDRSYRLCGPGERFDGAASLAIVPLTQGAIVIGALVVAADVPGVISREEARLLTLLAPAAVGALDAAWKLQAKASELEEQASRLEATESQLLEAKAAADRDRLTGLFSRRYFDEQYKGKIAELNRYPTELSLIVVDVDHFKRVNDTYGHATGDEVLRQVGRLLSEGARDVDVCARYGGEEIAILLPHTGERGALEMAERLRRNIERRPLVTNEGEIRITASFGVASFPESVSRPDGLFAAADQALYHAKHAGRNRVKAAKLSHAGKGS